MAIGSHTLFMVMLLGLAGIAFATAYFLDLGPKAKAAVTVGLLLVLGTLLLLVLYLAFHLTFSW